MEVARLLLESKADIHAAAQVPQAAQAMRTKPAKLLRRGWLCLALPVRAWITMLHRRRIAMDSHGPLSLCPLLPPSLFMDV